MTPAPEILDVTYANVADLKSAPTESKEMVPETAVPEAAATAPDNVTKTKLYVGTPCYSCLMTNTFLISLMQLQAECSRRGIECFIDFIGNESLVQRARNVLTGRFLKSQSTHLLFIDADIGFRPDTVFRLLDADKDIVTACYPKKSYDWSGIESKLANINKPEDIKEPVSMMGLDFNINLVGTSAAVKDGFVRVLDSATGFMMIKRGVIERMVEKFKDTLTCVNDLPGNREDPGYCKEYVALFDCMIDPQTRRYLSEDYSFVRRAQELGVEIWADLASPLCHVGHYTFEGDLRQRFALSYAA